MATLESRTTSPEAAFHKFTVEAWSLLSAALAITGIRIAFRVSAIGARHLCWDDYLVCVGALFYVVETTLAYSVGNVAHGLANGGMTDEQRAALSPEDPEHRLRIIGSKIQIAGWTTYGTMLWLYKTCMLITYARLTAGLSKSYRKQVYGGFALLAATFIALLGITFFSCRPFHKYWQINPNPGTVCQPALSIQIIWSNLALNATTDLYLMTIPVPMLWKSGLKLSKKIAWTILLTSGVFIVACALLRSIFITIDPINGPQTAGAWGVRESFVATVVTNLPIIFPRLQHYFKKHLGPILSLRSSQSNQFPTDFQTIGGGGRGKRSAEARNLDAYPLPTKLTVTESAEQLVDEPIELENGTLGTSSRRNSHGHEQHAHAESSKAHGT